jgi:hypothetical protein
MRAAQTDHGQGMNDMESQEYATRRIWKPVRRHAADSLLILFMASFGITVIFTRVFLELTGYPQVGDSTFHIAHVLWGGLLLFIAMLLLLLFSNTYVLWVGALAGGIGVGLFIDEVGKFITQSNDYFFPLAFPIMYAFMLVCVWLFLRVRRTQSNDTRTLLYHALEDLKQVLDHDLDPFEHAELTAELNKVIATTSDPSQRRLALELLDFVKSREVKLARDPMWMEKLVENSRLWLAHNPSRIVLKILIIAGFIAMVAQAVIKFAGLTTIAISVAGNDQTWRDVLGEFVIISGKSSYAVSNPTLLLMQNIFIIFTGAMALTTVILMLSGRERLALRVGTLALVIALTIVNLITFYFSQLYTVAEAMGQLFLLAVTQIYRWRFYLNQPAVVTQPAPTQTPSPVSR